METKKSRSLMYAKNSDIKIRTCITSIARTGSNLVKNIIEDVTGYYCGDDMRADLPSTSWLVEHDQVKGKVDEVFVIKTHYPTTDSKFLRISQDFKVNKAIILVRNPIDIVPSFLDLMYHKNHVSVSSAEFYNKNPELFQLAIEAIAENCENHYQFWIRQNIPTYILSYERLFKDPRGSLKEVLSFEQGFDISETELDLKLLKRLEEGLTTTYLSKPRTTGSKVAFYTTDQLKSLYEFAPNFIKAFGYESSFKDALGQNFEMKNLLVTELDIAEWNSKGLMNSYKQKNGESLLQEIEIPGGHRSEEKKDKNYLLSQKLNSIGTTSKQATNTN